MNAANICLLAINLWLGEARVSEGRLVTMQSACVEVADKAREQGMDRYLALAMAWEESRFTPTAVSPEGAVGTMQVIPRWACPNRVRQGCDLVAAGVRAYLTWLKQYREPSLALCHYNSGNRCNERSRGYARRVERKAVQLRQAANDAAYVGRR
jgi:soluble lytic murein transglycosylase-like protein